MSTLKCCQSPHRQYGATQHILSHTTSIPRWPAQTNLIPRVLSLCTLRKCFVKVPRDRTLGTRLHTDEHMGWCNLALFVHAKNVNVSTLGPRFLVKFNGSNRGQMPHKCPGSPAPQPSPPSGLTLIDALIALLKIGTIMMIEIVSFLKNYISLDYCCWSHCTDLDHSKLP